MSADSSTARAEAIADIAARIEAAAARHGRTPAEIAAQVLVDGLGGYDRIAQPDDPRGPVRAWLPGA